MFNPITLTTKARMSYFAIVAGLFSILHVTPAQAVEIEVDPGAYIGGWSLDLVPGPTGPQTMEVEPGNHLFRTPVGAFGIAVDGDGFVTSLNPVAATGVGNVVTFNTAPITFDPGVYGYNTEASWTVFGGGTGTSAPETFHLVKGLNWTVQVGARGLGWIDFQIDANGSINLVDPAAAATAVGNVLTFNTTPVTIDPATYGYNGIGAWDVAAADRFQTNGIPTPQTLNLLPGIGYQVRVGSARFALFYFRIDENGNVISLNTDAALGSGNTLTFNTTPITIDPAAYGDNDVADWYVGGVGTFQSAGTSTPEVLNVVPTLEYLIAVGPQRAANTFQIDVDASGNITSLNTDAANAAGSVLTFNSTAISVSTSSGLWLLRNVTTSLSGIQNLNIVPGLEYLIDSFSSVGWSTLNFSVAEPCAVDPTESILGDFTFNITCGALDGDNDGVPDDTDNCPVTPNPDQVDQDLDGLGDVCDLDLDGDGIDNDLDNCPDLSNPDQSDLDGDGIGDACDSDIDGDAVPDNDDNCPFVSNTDQANSDDDPLGDACDLDDDNDNVLDEFDNCRVIFNPDQTDFDRDGEGDACDGDADGDGIENNIDACPDSPLGQSINIDGCTGAQLIAQRCQVENFVQHGQYVSCVAHAANDAVAQELISPKEKAQFVKEAAKSK